MKKIMKFFVLMILSICLLCNTSISVFALENNTYDQEEVEENKDNLVNNNEEIISDNSSTEEISALEENSDTENSIEHKEIIGSVKTVDIDGNIIEVDVYDGTLSKKNTKLRSNSLENVSVNFNCYGNSVINYTNAITKESGYLSATSGADAAFLGMENGKVKFMTAGVIGLVEPSKVQLYTSEEYWSYYTVQGDAFYHYIITDVANPNSYLKIYVGKAPTYLKNGTHYLSYDGHYFYTDYDVMLNDYRVGIRTNSNNSSNPYYNYYQYLSFRVPSNYSASEINNYISSISSVTEQSKMKNIGNDLVNNQNLYGSNALMMMGIAANESSWGNSAIAKNKNNIFGLNAVDSNPGGNADVFDSISSCVLNFASGWISRQYANPNNWVYNGAYLGDKSSGANVRYASDQYWGEKNAAVIWAMDNKNGNKDYNNYSIGVKNTLNNSSNVNVFQNETSNNVLYNIENITNYAVTILNTTTNSSRMRIVSDAVLTPDRSSTVNDSKYNFIDMYAYIDSDLITLINDVETKFPPSISNVKITGMSTEGYTIEADVENADNISKIIFPTWSAVNGQDDVVYGNGVIKGNKVTYQVKTKDHQYDTGDYLTRIYIYDKKGKEYYGGEYKAVVKENIPSISNVQFTGMSAEGYTIEADVENADNISKIIFPTWSAVNGQDDVVYGDGIISGNKVTFQVKTKDHHYDTGDYLTRIYIYDKEGYEYYGGEHIAVVKGNVPSISNVQFTGMSVEGYTIEADVENADNISKIIFPTWSAVNGQDDVVYGNGVIKGNKVTFQVKTKDHQYDAGDYLTRIYIYDKEGNEYYGGEHKVNVAIYPPSISNVQFTGMNAEGYTIEADVENADNISKIIFPTWSAVNGQDDVVYGNGVIKGNKVTFQVKTKDHQYDTGDYLTRIYIYDKKGKEYYGGEHKVLVKGNAPSISNVQFTGMSAEGYTIEADVENADNISKIIFPTWSAVNGQDDVVYGNGVIKGNKVTYQVKTKDHQYDTGDYLTRIYIYDKKGKEYYGGEYKAVVKGNTPSISNVQFTGMSAEGYTIEADVENADNISKIIFPTWSAVNGQDDVVYGNGVIKGSKVTFQVKTKDHQYDAGDYLTRIYIYDKKGKEYYGDEHKVNVAIYPPSISNVQFTGMSAEGYTIEADVENADNISKIIFPTWSAVNGQDDVVYGDGVIKGNRVTFQVKTKDHQYDTGDYLTRIYIYDKKGKEYYGGEHKAVVKGNAPSISNVQFTGMSAEGYTIEADVENADNISKIIFPTWSAVNGQDDVVYGDGVIKGNKVTFQVKTKDHQYDTGDYLTRIYIYDKEGNEYYGGEHKAHVIINKPEILNTEILDIDSNSFLIKVKSYGDLNVFYTKFSIWTSKNGNDDIDTSLISVENGEATYKVERKNHNYEYGEYIINIYAIDKANNESNIIELKKDLKKPEIVGNKPIVYNVSISDYSSDGYTINCEIDSEFPITKVIFPTWTVYGNQDDLKWYEGKSEGNGKYSCRINRNNHNNELGLYQTRIYAYDTKNNESEEIEIYQNIINDYLDLGWQIIDGKKYFYNNLGQLVGNGPSKKIIDVSEHQGSINWDLVKKYGNIDGVILRCGYSWDGEDKQFARNVKELNRLGIPYGVYLYTYASNAYEAKLEANFTMSLLKKYNVNLSYPIYYDVEDWKYTDGSKQAPTDTSTWISIITTYLETMNSGGYNNVDVYSYRYLLQTRLNHQSILKHVSWAAAYTDELGWENPYYKGNFGWQYTSSGQISGITGNVDISCWFNN